MRTEGSAVAATAARFRMLDRCTRVAEPAFTARTTAGLRTDEEYDFEEVQTLTFFRGVTPGCVALIGAAGKRQPGYWGEPVSTAPRVRGATDVAVDGGIHDGIIPMGIENRSLNEIRAGAGLADVYAEYSRL